MLAPNRLLLVSFCLMVAACNGAETINFRCATDQQLLLTQESISHIRIRGERALIRGDNDKKWININNQFEADSTSAKYYDGAFFIEIDDPNIYTLMAQRTERDECLTHFSYGWEKDSGALTAVEVFCNASGSPETRTTRGHCSIE